jgi:hypothetical protein
MREGIVSLSVEGKIVYFSRSPLHRVPSSKRGSMNTQEPSTWQELLGQLIAHPQERTRLAAALHIRPITLQRWIQGTSRPRDENLRLLLKNIPRENYPHFLHLLIVDFPELLREELPQERPLPGLPAEFYARAMSNLALTPRSIYRQSMQELILQQILQHLDPDQDGLSVALAIWVPPRGGRKVRSLREVARLATPPWPRYQEEKPALLGLESLVGFAIAHAHSCVINSRDELTIYPVQWIAYEKSTAAFPILRLGRFVGALIIGSTREFFFTTPRLTIIEEYAHLATCIFELEASFDPDEIELGIMPPYEQQYPYFADYHQRVSRKLLETGATGQPMTLQQARQAVWQDLEDILLQIVSQTEVESFT